MRSLLEEARRKFQPSLPDILQNVHAIGFERQEIEGASEKISTLFPHLSCAERLLGVRKKESDAGPLKVGVFFSGGQAPGGHNVITGLYDALQKLHPGSRLFGFLGGPSGVIEGKQRELKSEELFAYRNQGGFDLIGSGRTKIETKEQLDAALLCAQKLELDGLVVIGGDDSNTNAAYLAEHFKAEGCGTHIIGVPKTIDGDLRNPYVSTPFGFDSACKIYAESIGNIAKDALSAKKYTHFIKLMGRSASHVALECALLTQVNLTLISEEVRKKGWTLSILVSQITDLICQRAELGKNYSVILIPEGIIEFLTDVSKLVQELNTLLAKSSPITLLTPPSKECFDSLPPEIQKQLLLGRDPHGNVQVSHIETEKLFIELVGKELQKRKQAGVYRGAFSPLAHFLGYEGRAGLPSNFDCNYCYALGFVSALLIRSGKSGYMATVEDLMLPPREWKIGAVALPSLMHLEMRRGKEKAVVQKALVDLDSAPFQFFKKEREKWLLEDHYLCPGPMQFFGNPALTEAPPFSLLLGG